jgi:cytochrome b
MASRHAVQKAAGAAVVEVWDLPLRLFHWLLVLAVTLAIVTAKAGGEWMAWHGRTGLFILGLVVFRVVWGLVGSTHARFIHFAPTPGRIKAYLSGHWHGLGHNPLGALSVFALLGVLGYQSSTGLISNDDISFTGPLASLVSEELSLSLTGWHHRVGNALMALVGLHVAAILFYRLIKKENLVKPMVTGVKPVDEVPPGAPALVKARPLALWLTIAVSAVTVWAANGAWIRALATPVPASSVAAPAATSSAASQSAPAW